jgi:hypothetical protein
LTQLCFLDSGGRMGIMISVLCMAKQNAVC